MGGADDEEERERSKPPRIIDVSSTSRTASASSTIGRSRSSWSPRRWSARQLTPARSTATIRRGRRTASCAFVVRPSRRARRGRGGRLLHGARRRRRAAPATRTEGPVSWPAFCRTAGRSPTSGIPIRAGSPATTACTRFRRRRPPACLTATLDRNCEPLTGARPPWLGRTGALLFQVEDEGNVRSPGRAAGGGARTDHRRHPPVTASRLGRRRPHRLRRHRRHLSPRRSSCAGPTGPASAS